MPASKRNRFINKIIFSRLKILIKKFSVNFSVEMIIIHLQFFSPKNSECLMNNLPKTKTMYHAFVNKDISFEGIFYTGVKTTGIFL